MLRLWKTVQKALNERKEKAEKLQHKIKRKQSELTKERKFLRNIKRILKGNQTPAIIKLSYNNLIPEKTRKINRLRQQIKRLEKKLIPEETVVFT